MKTLTHDYPRLHAMMAVLYLETFPAHSQLGNMEEVG